MNTVFVLLSLLLVSSLCMFLYISWQNRKAVNNSNKRLRKRTLGDYGDLLNDV